MNWSGQKEFAASKIVPFLVDGKEAGLLKSHGPLSFLKVSLSLSPPPDMNNKHLNIAT